MQRAIGEKGLILSRILLAVAHWQFTVGQMTFILESLNSTAIEWSPTKTALPVWVFGIAIVLVYSPLAAIRRLQDIFVFFLLALVLILVALVTTSYFALDLANQEGGHGPDYSPINPQAFWTMLGFAFYTLEGIGCLLPILRETEHPENFPYLVFGA